MYLHLLQNLLNVRPGGEEYVCWPYIQFSTDPYGVKQFLSLIHLLLFCSYPIFMSRRKLKEKVTLLCKFHKVTKRPDVVMMQVSHSYFMS